VSNVAYIIQTFLIQVVDSSKSDIGLVVNSILIYLVNLQTLCNVLFVQQQWLTTRKQLLRQAVTRDS